MGIIRELPADQIEALLHRAVIGRIACCAHGKTGNSRPYLVPLAFAYDGHSIYAHTGPGRKLDFMRAQPDVTFEVDEGSASDMWKSVIADASFEEIADEPDRMAALRLLYPDTPQSPILGKMTVVFRLRITAKSGRYETPD
ncbi:hypothetical protein BH23CHL5_BH23CHL5_23430 [soil metagenome]